MINDVVRHTQSTFLAQSMPLSDFVRGPVLSFRVCYLTALQLKVDTTSNSTTLNLTLKKKIHVYHLTGY